MIIILNGSTQPLTKPAQPSPKNNTTSTSRAEDQVSLGTTSNTPSPVTYTGKMFRAALRAVELKLPADQSILNQGAVKEFQLKTQDQAIRMNEICHSIENIQDMELAAELALYVFRNYANPKMVSSNIKDLDNLENKCKLLSQVVVSLVKTYKQEQIAGCEVLKGIGIRHLSNNQLSFHPTPGKPLFVQIQVPTQGNNPSVTDSAFDKVSSHIKIIMAAIKDGSHSLTAKAFSNMFKAADLCLSTIRDTTPEKYKNITKGLHVIICLLKDAYQEEITQRLKHHWQTNEELLQTISISFFDNKKYNQAIEWLEPNIGTLQGDVGKKCNHVLGKAYFCQEDYNKALQYTEAAHKISPKDQLLTMQVITCYHKAGFSSIEFIDNLPDSDLKKMLQLVVNLDNVTLIKLRGIITNNIDPQFRNIIYQLKVIAEFNEIMNQNQAIDIKVFNEKIESLAKDDVSLRNRCAVALHVGLTDTARNILAQIPSNEIQKDFYLQQLKVLLDNSSSNVQDTVQDSLLDTEPKAKLYATAGEAAIANETPEVALAHVEEGLKLNPEDKNLAEVGFAAALLSDNKEKAREFIEKLTDVQKDVLAFEYATDEVETPDINGIVDNYDPKKIHHDNLLRKQQKLAESRLAISFLCSDNTSWSVKKENIKAADAVAIRDKENNDKILYHAHIPERIKRKVGDENMGKFLTALVENGIASRKEGDSGIIFLGSAIELKILGKGGDLRLFTGTIYTNKNGKKLIVFDREGNHDDVKSFVSENKRINYVNA